MGILDGLVKGFAMAAASGFGARKLLQMNGQASSMIVNIGTGCAATCGLLYYSRVWIQGCWIDRSYNSNVDLKGRCVVITGGTIGGIGYAAAEIFAKMGATVILTCRSTSKGEAAIQKLKKTCGTNNDNNNIQYVTMDFLSNGSVRKGAADIQKLTDRLDFLILNAGIANGPHANIWQTNHVGPFLLVQQLAPLLKKTSGSRVVSVSSGAHKNAQIHWADPCTIPEDQRSLFGGAYGQSKLANIMHMRELPRHFQLENTTKCFAVTPGAVATNIMGNNVHWAMKPLLAALLRSPTLGAQVIKMACLDPSIPSGSYLSNCRVKETEGLDGCSNDAGQAKKLWELTERQVQENKFP